MKIKFIMKYVFSPVPTLCVSMLKIHIMNIEMNSGFWMCQNLLCFLWIRLHLKHVNYGAIEIWRYQMKEILFNSLSKLIPKQNLIIGYVIPHPPLKEIVFHQQPFWSSQGAFLLCDCRHTMIKIFPEALYRPYEQVGQVELGLTTPKTEEVFLILPPTYLKTFYRTACYPC